MRQFSFIPNLLNGDPAVTRPGALRRSVLTVVCFGLIYGLCMGTFGGLGNDRRMQLLLSAIKVPALLGVTFALAVPSSFVLHALAGLRSDFGKSIRALAAGQAMVTVVLAALAPFTLLFYASTRDYGNAVIFNGLMFAVATFSAQFPLRKLFAGLILSNPRHRVLLRTWVIIYCFIAIQMAWVLRPFVGNPAEPVAIFRPGAWSNAYVVVFEMVRRLIS